jgi:glycosyltransferase involved in cell wall biosynthesis
MEQVNTSLAGLARDSKQERRLATASVAICAYSTARWADLQLSVRSVVDQLRPGDECVVVIDHNEELLAMAVAVLSRHSAVRIVASSGERGLSGARNTAIAESRGDVVAFLDDDAAAGEGWLLQMVEALAEDDVLGVGTAAIPRWPAQARPGWFPPEFDWVIGCSYRGLPTERAHVRNVIGVAMAFRREVFDLAGTFSTDVGRVGLAPTGCEETELCIRLRQARPSSLITYLPDVTVSHRVTTDRVRLGYFFRRCLGEGRSKARVSRLVGAGDALMSERSYVRSVLPKAMLRELRRALRGDIAGLGAATMIVLGVLLAGSGYVAVRAIGIADA